MSGVKTRFEIRLPELGEGILQATLVVWHCRVGDYVQKDDDIVEFVTDKAVFQVSAGTSGTIQEICYREGDEVPVGAVVAIMEVPS